MPGPISYSYPQLLAAADQLRAMSEDCSSASRPALPPDDGQGPDDKRERPPLQSAADQLESTYQSAVGQVSRTLAMTAETLRAVAEDYRQTEEEARTLIHSRLSELEDRL